MLPSFDDEYFLLSLQKYIKWRHSGSSPSLHFFKDTNKKGTGLSLCGLLRFVLNALIANINFSLLAAEDESGFSLWSKVGLDWTWYLMYRSGGHSNKTMRK